MACLHLSFFSSSFLPAYKPKYEHGKRDGPWLTTSLRLGTELYWQEVAKRKFSVIEQLAKANLYEIRQADKIYKHDLLIGENTRQTAES